MSLLFELVKPAIMPTLLSRDSDGAMPLHTAILNNWPNIVSTLSSAGDQESLYSENGVGTTPLEMVTQSALVASISGDRIQDRGDPFSANAFSTYYSGESCLEPQPGYSFADETDIQRLREVLDHVIAAGSLSKKPFLLEILVAFAEQCEKDMRSWKEATREDIVVTKEVSSSGRLDQSDPLKTFDVFTRAVLPVHQRILVHLNDVQQVVFNAVDKLAGKKTSGTTSQYQAANLYGDDLGGQQPQWEPSVLFANGSYNGNAVLGRGFEV